MSLRVTLVQGGGIGYDLVPAVQHILDKAGVGVIWDEHLAGGEAMARGQEPLAPRRAARKTDANMGGVSLPEGMVEQVASMGELGAAEHEAARLQVAPAAPIDEVRRLAQVAAKARPGRT